MLVNVLLPAFHPGDGTPRRFFFQAQIRLPYTRGSVRRASGFVLTGKQEVTDVNNPSRITPQTRAQPVAKPRTEKNGRDASPETSSGKCRREMNHHLV